jgi:PhnO protein
VRRFTALDHAAVIALLRQLWPGHSVDGAAVARTCRRTLRDGSVTYLVAEQGARVVGMLSVAVSWNLWRCGPVACINELVVDHRVRRGGVGRALMRAAERIAARRGCLAVELDSAPQRRAAHAFYEALGYAGRAIRFSKELPRISRRPRRG